MLTISITDTKKSGNYIYKKVVYKRKKRIVGYVLNVYISYISGFEFNYAISDFVIAICILFVLIAF